VRARIGRKSDPESDFPPGRPKRRLIIDGEARKRKEERIIDTPAGLVLFERNETLVEALIRRKLRREWSEQSREWRLGRFTSRTDTNLSNGRRFASRFSTLPRQADGDGSATCSRVPFRDTHNERNNRRACVRASGR